MVFNNLFFIFCFLPISAFLYFILPFDRLKNIILLFFSLLFYAWDSPAYVILLLLNIGWNYLTGMELETHENDKSRKWIFWFAILVNLLILGLFKYTNFILGIFSQPGFDVGLPVGLSFYTFSAISYLADVYKGTSPTQKNLVSLGLYISFFGKVTSGPIAFYHDMEPQLEHHPFQKELFFSGLALFTKGLIKKVLFADQFLLVFSALSTNTSLVGTWLYALSYMLEIYFDFSGYSDMAIGIGRIFGFEMKLNFDHPYSAKSVQDFWRRWHISLSMWFRDYVYIPLGGNRHDYIRNILIVWFLTGLWHGANWTFILWGLYYAMFLLLEKFVLRKYLEKFPRFVGHFYTLLVVFVGWIFFFSPSIGEAFSTMGRLFNVGEILNTDALFVLTSHLLLFVLGILLSGTLFDKISSFVFKKYERQSSLVYTVGFSFCFLLCVAFIIGSTYQSFLYFAF